LSGRVWLGEEVVKRFEGRVMEIMRLMGINDG